MKKATFRLRSRSILGFLVQIFRLITWLNYITFINSLSIAKAFSIKKPLVPHPNGLILTVDNISYMALKFKPCLSSRDGLG